ncbi:MAG: hypothetical protein Kow0062_28010 [Acidobacteriota bacterium]
MRRMIGIRVGVAVVFLVVAAIGIGAVVAGAEECRRECQDRFADDLAACADAFDQARAEIDAQYQECLAGAQSFFDRLRCLVERETALDQAKLERARCEHAAETDFAQCLLDCETSPSAP